MQREPRSDHAELGRQLRGSADAIDLFARRLAGLMQEQLLVAHLDGEGWLLGVSAAEGGDDRIDLPIREIVREALALGSRALVLAHNHPSGDATPSGEDLAATRRLAETVRSLDIRLVDHLIFGGEDCRSFRALGLL